VLRISAGFFALSSSSVIFPPVTQTSSGRSSSLVDGSRRGAEDAEGNVGTGTSLRSLRLCASAAPLPFPIRPEGENFRPRARCGFIIRRLGMSTPRLLRRMLFPMIRVNPHRQDTATAMAEPPGHRAEFVARRWLAQRRMSVLLCALCVSARVSPCPVRSGLRMKVFVRVRVAVSSITRLGMKPAELAGQNVASGDSCKPASPTRRHRDGRATGPQGGGRRLSMARAEAQRTQRGMSVTLCALCVSARVLPPCPFRSGLRVTVFVRVCVPVSSLRGLE